MERIVIDPGENGVHSLAMALEAFNKLHENTEDIFSLKDSIMRADHSIETLAKDLIFQIEPALLISDKQSKPIDCLKKGYINYFEGKYSTMLDECQTVGLEECLDFLRDLRLITMNKDDFNSYKASVKELRKFRNRAQHFGIDADPERVKRILGNTIPQSIEVFQKAYDELYSRDEFRQQLSSIPRFSSIPIMDYLKRHWPDALIWLNTLKMEYCDSIQQAVNFFKVKEFLNESLVIELEHHGIIGAPPYLPELKLTGVLNLNYDMMTIDYLYGPRGYLRSDEKQLRELDRPYYVDLVIDQPNIERNSGDFVKSIVNGKISLSGHIKRERLESILKLSGAEKEIATLRDAVIAISADLEYTMEAYVSSHHFSSESIKNAKGKLSIILTAFTKGYESAESAEINGRYVVTLDETNASFKLHTSMKPDGETLDLDKGYTFEWTIDAKGPLQFR